MIGGGLLRPSFLLLLKVTEGFETVSCEANGYTIQSDLLPNLGTSMHILMSNLVTKDIEEWRMTIFPGVF